MQIKKTQTERGRKEGRITDGISLINLYHLYVCLYLYMIERKKETNKQTYI